MANRGFANYKILKNYILSTRIVIIKSELRHRVFCRHKHSVYPEAGINDDFIKQNTLAWRVILQDTDHTVVSEQHDLIRSGKGKHEFARTSVRSYPAERNTGAISNVDFHNHLAASITNIHVLNEDEYYFRWLITVWCTRSSWSDLMLEMKEDCKFQEQMQDNGIFLMRSQEAA